MTAAMHDELAEVVGSAAQGTTEFVADKWGWKGCLTLFLIASLIIAVAIWLLT